MFLKNMARGSPPARLGLVMFGTAGSNPLGLARLGSARLGLGLGSARRGWAGLGWARLGSAPTGLEPKRFETQLEPIHFLRWRCRP